MADEALLAYEVTITQEHSARYVVRAPSADEAKRVAEKRWESCDYERHTPLHTWVTPPKRVPEHDNDALPDDCICPRILGRMVDRQSWCPIHGEKPEHSS